MQVNYKKRIEDIYKKLDELNTQGLQIVLDMIYDVDNSTLYHKIKLLDRHNNILQEDDIPENPREYIDKYTEKYKVKPRLDFYNIENGKMIYQPTLAEREKLERDANKC